MSTKACYTTASDIFGDWQKDVLEGEAPVLYPVGSGDLERVEIGPGLVTLIGGPPGAGKTAFTMQCAIEALRLTPGLRALVCNVEMSPKVLLDRQLARLSGIDLTTIRSRRFKARYTDQVNRGIRTLGSVVDRLGFVQPPFDLNNVVASAAALGADYLLLDYIQRIAPPRKHDNPRSAVSETMSDLRMFADDGKAVLAVSAISRSKDKQGRSSYQGSDLGLGSFRESSELEFGADSAWILASDDGSGDDAVTLRHLKDRYGEVRDIALHFDRRRQKFGPFSFTNDKDPSQKTAESVGTCNDVGTALQGANDV